HEIKSWDGAQQRARSFANFLPVKQVAGVLIGDAQRIRLERCNHPKRRDKFRDVPHAQFELLGSLVFRLVWREQVGIFLQSGPTTGSVCDDRVEFLAGEGLEVASSEVTSGFPDACVRSECSATDLPWRHEYLTAVGNQNAYGCIVQPRKSDLRDAASKEGTACPAFASRVSRRVEKAEEEVIVNVGQQRFAFGEADRPKHAGFAHDRLHAPSLIDAQESGE